ncbi:MAG: ornithine carbamoyltransferase [Elusimicrobia bacterium RIFOXYA12_FULL_51_18]|nr:MAG: ornithine carbamoyltransferase [Elusimicrobia bacterium RIFOXYA12_FULL_51_18]OGS29199.1 MAG: ornithine carbamoyltransferase [Elusimicrobia bacterium RIFOXYA2_FULL_53_38]
MNKKDFLRVADYTKSEINEIFDLTGKIKARQKKSDPARPLEGKTLGMIFQKSSTRTRVSFEVGMYQLGGYPLFLSANDLQLKRGETIADTARVLSRMLDAIMIRTYAHSEVEELARHATVPVINGLTDSHHPCQIMADIYTIMEHRKSVKGLTVAWVGDGNNVLHSWMEGAPLTGMNLRMAVPPGYEPDKDILKFGVELAKKEGTQMLLTNDPAEAVAGADVIYTDVWVSMGQDAEKEKKLHDFKGFQINEALMERANKDYLFMHCLPAHRGEEVSEAIIDGKHSIILDEAENRLHVQKAILTAHILRGKTIKI